MYSCLMTQLTLKLLISMTTDLQQSSLYVCLVLQRQCQCQSAAAAADDDNDDDDNKVANDAVTVWLSLEMS